MHRLLLVAWHTAVIYFSLVLGLRLVGRRSLAQLHLIDLAVILLLGSAVETAMIAADTSLQAGLMSAGVLFACNMLLTRLMRFRRLRRLFAGGPVLLIHHGQVQTNRLQREALTEADLEEAVRERGYAGLDDVEYAVLESEGTISVVPRRSPGKQKKHRS